MSKKAETVIDLIRNSDKSALAEAAMAYVEAVDVELGDCAGGDRVIDMIEQTYAMVVIRRYRKRLNSPTATPAGPPPPDAHLYGEAPRAVSDTPGMMPVRTVSREELELEFPSDHPDSREGA